VIRNSDGPCAIESADTRRSAGSTRQASGFTTRGL
jgi:hypothetical protein